MKFKDFGLTPEVLAVLDAVGFETATPIQERAIPILRGGQDLIGVAETGTGKTLAFLLPILEKLTRGVDDPQALVVCPTRELAVQVGGEADRFGKPLGFRTTLAYGGTSSGEQKRLLAEGCDIVVGTPGRLLDFLTSAWLSVRALRFVVLDEADRMLDMGFINDVDSILRKTPMSRQTMLFSATFPEAVERLAQRYMLHPEMVQTHSGTRVVSTVDHAMYPVTRSQKDELVVEIIRREKPKKALIFTATREGTSELALRLRRFGHEVISLSSLLSQANRERALSVFRRGECDILVATDVAARGLDITDIDLVVNFDVPTQPEDYVHRIGRTGRAERSGKAITLVSELDERRAADIDRQLGETVPRVTLDDFDYRPRSAAPRRSSRPGGGGRSRSDGAARGGSRRPRSAPRREAAPKAEKPPRSDAGGAAETAGASTAAAKPRRRRRRGGKGRSGGESGGGTSGAGD